MITVTLVAIASAFGLSVLVSKRKKGATSIVLAALPIALLFLILPIPPAIWGMIRGFQQIGQSGGSGIVQAAALCLDISRPLFWGSIGFVLVMATAAAIQTLAQPDDPEQAPDDPKLVPDRQPSNRPTGLAETVFLAASSLLVVPSVALVHLTAGIPRLVMEAANRLKEPPDAAAATAAASLSLKETSELISSRLVASMLVGIPLSLLLLVACVGGLIVLRSRQPPRWLAMYAWAVWAVCIVLAVWNAVQLNADIRAFALAMR